jgi:polygalacturonase
MKIDIYKKDIFTRIFLYLFLSITFPVFLSAQYVYTPSEVFSVKVNDEPVFVEYYKTVPDEYGSTLRWPLENVSICHILFTGAMTIEITCNKSFQNYNISPKRHDINHYRDGNKVIVTINKPCKFNINMDNDNNVNEQVFFFVDLLENTPDLQDSNVKNIMNYPGADNTGTVDITNVIQSAINGLSSGQTLFFPKGQYLSKYLKLKSNMTLYLEKDAILLGTKNSNDYYWASGQDGGFLLIKDCNNTKIAGYGRINLRGEEMQEIAGKNLHIRTVFIQGISTNIVLQDFFALDPPRANIQISSNNVTLRNVKALSTQAGSNTDGIDPMNGKDLLFDNCFIYGRDDAIAIKSYFRPSSIYPPFTPANIFVANSLFSSLEATMKVGTETERTDTIKNIIFENCDALYAGHAMSLWTKDFSSIKDVYFRNIGVDRIKPSPYVQQGSIFHFNVIPRDDTKNPGLISNVWAERIFSESLGVRKSDVVGQPVNKKNR